NESDLEALGFFNGAWLSPDPSTEFTIATSSIRRIAQWLHRHPGHRIDNLRGNVNTRLRKLDESSWNGAIFAAAGVERIGLRPERSVDLDWMLPAPAQGAIMIVCREDDDTAFSAAAPLNDADTALCTRIERDFLRTLMGGCSTPISALAHIEKGSLHFKGNILSIDGKQQAAVERMVEPGEAEGLGTELGLELLNSGGASIVESIRKKGMSANNHA
ncbi:MAG TPA: hypothetical protein VFR58_01545, partial [Flavisolibacter sp.]|nr:hypothetical protein [Flavisolibacter sp.]